MTSPRGDERELPKMVTKSDEGGEKGSVNIVTSLMLIFIHHNSFLLLYHLFLVLMSIQNFQMTLLLIVCSLYFVLQQQKAIM